MTRKSNYRLQTTHKSALPFVLQSGVGAALLCALEPKRWAASLITSAHDKAYSMNPQLVEIASWHIISEFQHRYPNKFKVIETHPGGGQYDCLSLYDVQQKELVADLNRRGSFHASNGKRITDIWQKTINTSNLEPVLEEIRQMLGLPEIKAIPLYTPTTIVYEFIAVFLANKTLQSDGWECRNGNYDTSGDGGGVVRDFEDFPKAQEQLKIKLDDDILRQPAYRFWFIRKNDKPLLCLETSGFLWTKDSTQTYDLMNLYVQNLKAFWHLLNQ